MCYTTSARPVCPNCAGRTGLADTVDVEKTCKLAARCPYRQSRPLPRRPRPQQQRRGEEKEEESVISRRRCAACVRRAITAANSVPGPADMRFDVSTTSTTSTTTTTANSTDSVNSVNSIVRRGFAAMSREWEVQTGRSAPGRLGEAYPEKENTEFWKAVFGCERRDQARSSEKSGEGGLAVVLFIR
ncbi:hypothetical protein AYL99_07844 [Fonsecaea erecta]|uniref:Uncharacterized protein n=1 Tax=Fonsecaea erecta TaxID=1367422 RepID=A0A178ZG22_9EURO|nr:hypothetical protein AYL99_07844 [Fonsecaea erecta]OAP58754.1 hypothetical protein AYL99_07844 [Fonsecaea erecta]